MCFLLYRSGSARGDARKGVPYRDPCNGTRNPVNEVSSCVGPTTPTRAGRLADASVDPTEARWRGNWLTGVSTPLLRFAWR